MKSNKNLTNKLDKLEAQKANFSSFDNLSVLQFIKYKKIISQEKKINNQLSKNILLGNEINFWYDSTTKSWINNPKINCRKYCKMERKAEYKKNIKLYKLGLLTKKPSLPIIQSINNSLYPVKDFFKNNVKPILIKYNFFKKIYNKYDYFKSQILPQKINNLAVNTASIGIKGYRYLKSDCRYIRNSIASKNSFMYFKNVIREANKKLDNPPKANNFKESLKLENFKSNDFVLNNSVPNKKNNHVYSNQNNNSTIPHFKNNELAEYYFSR